MTSPSPRSHRLCRPDQSLRASSISNTISSPVLSSLGEGEVFMNIARDFTASVGPAVSRMPHWRLPPVLSKLSLLLISPLSARYYFEGLRGRSRGPSHIGSSFRWVLCGRTHTGKNIVLLCAGLRPHSCRNLEPMLDGHRARVSSETAKCEGDSPQTCKEKPAPVQHSVQGFDGCGCGDRHRALENKRTSCANCENKDQKAQTIL